MNLLCFMGVSQKQGRIQQPLKNDVCGRRLKDYLVSETRIISRKCLIQTTLFLSSRIFYNKHNWFLIFMIHYVFSMFSVSNVFLLNDENFLKNRDHIKSSLQHSIGCVILNIIALRGKGTNMFVFVCTVCSRHCTEPLSNVSHLIITVIL